MTLCDNIAMYIWKTHKMCTIKFQISAGQRSSALVPILAKNAPVILQTFYIQIKHCMHTSKKQWHGKEAVLGMFLYHSEGKS